MPIRVTSRAPEPEGPRPFSQEWLSAPSEAVAPRPRATPRRSPWEGLLAALVVLSLVVVTLPWRDGVPLASTNGDTGSLIAAPIVEPTATAGSAAVDPTPELGAAAQVPVTSPVADRAEPAQTPTATLIPVGSSMAGAIFPENRVLSFYGFPGVEQMGILGAYELPELLVLLEEQAAAFEAVDPSRPVKLALEVITSVAQSWEGDDGDYLAYIGRNMLMEYIDFAAANDLLIILDMQFGRKTVQQEFDAVREFLLYPHVHLALDPEFAVDEGEVPGTVVGQIDAADVQYALEELATLSRENNLPPKLLIVHQFTEKSITNREQIVPIPGVQYVLEVDGFGPPDAKRETYRFITAGSTSPFFGFKLWYQQDVPLMTEAEVLELEPSPDLIIYQ